MHIYRTQRLKIHINITIQGVVVGGGVIQGVPGVLYCHKHILGRPTQLLHPLLLLVLKVRPLMYTLGMSVSLM